MHLNSILPVDIVRVKSCVDSLHNSTKVPVRVLVNKLNLVPEQIMPGLVDVFRNGRSLSSLKPYISLIRSCMHLPVLPMYTLLHSQGINDLNHSGRAKGSVTSSHNANNALDRNPPTTSKVCDTPITKHGRTNGSTQ